LEVVHAEEYHRGVYVAQLGAVDEVEQLDYGLFGARETVAAVKGGFGTLGDESVF
jgi:hypothetical protein